MSIDLKVPVSSGRRPRTTREPLPKGTWGGRLLAAPMMAYLIAFFVAPLLLLAVYSFLEFNLLTFSVKPSVTFDNYKTLFGSVYIGSIIRSFAVTIAMTIGCMVIGFPVALTISRLRGPAKAVLLVAVIVPYWISFVVRTYAWLELLAPNGFISKALASLHLVDKGTELGYNVWAIGIGMLAGYLPLMILPMFMALDRIDPALIDAGADLGLHGVSLFWKVIFPLAMPGTIAGVLLVGIPATGEYTIPAILGGDKTLLAGNIEAQQFLQTGNYPFGAAIATVLMVLMLLVMFASRRRLDQAGDIT